MLCDKCKFGNNSPVSLHEAGVTYYLCENCHNEYLNFPTTSLSLYLGKDPESQVSKNIREARERRSKGYSLWS